MLVIPEMINGVIVPIDVFVSIIQPHFDFPIKERISIRADINQFKYLEDSSVYAQARENAPKFYEVYWDGVWICDFNEMYTKEQVEKSFFEGFEVEYSSGRINLSEEVEEEITTSQRINNKLSEARKMSEATPEEAIMKEAIKETIEEKKQELNKKKKIIERKI